MRHPRRAFTAPILLLAGIFLAGCQSAPAPTASREPAISAIALDGVTLSGAARATSVAPPSSYGSIDDALRAGDTAAYLVLLSQMPEEERAQDMLYDGWLAIDRVADGDFKAARARLGLNGENAAEDDLPGFYLWLDSWFLALEGQSDLALERHRSVATLMPGITGDLSLAAMLEASGRNEEALAVYEALTPATIIAPEHEFDPRGIVYTHVSTVIVRHALLLQRMGRVEDAKEVYQTLAQAEPEYVTSHAAALESLETGQSLDNKALTPLTGFSQSLSDVGTALYEQRYIQLALSGYVLSGLDSERVAFDLVTLIIDPQNESARDHAISSLYGEALFDGAAHVALTAPEQTPSLQVSAAQALIMAKEEKEARKALKKALELSSDDDRLSTLYGTAQMTMLLDDKDQALRLLPQIMKLAANPAEEASAHGLASSVYAYFGDIPRAVEHAQTARELDDTHERRTALADLLGQEGKINEALLILRSAHLARPNDPYTLNSLGYFLITRTDRLDEGYRILARAILLAPSDPYITDSFGWALYHFGEVAQAREIVESAQQELMPHRHWEVEDHLGDLYWHQNQPEQARKSWQTALENHPPRLDRQKIADKLSKGLSGQPPEKRPVPAIRIDDGEIARRDI